MPPLIEGSLEIDPVVFDPSVREAMTAFFRQALAREVKQRFGNADDMRRAWLHVFQQVQQLATLHPRKPGGAQKCPISEAQADTQIGLLPLSAQALDTLTRLNINRVDELLRLPRNELVRMTGVGTQTRRELSELIAQLQARLGGQPSEVSRVEGEGLTLSVDQLLRSILPETVKPSDPDRRRFLNEYLGRLDREAPTGSHNVHWPTLISLGAEIAMEPAQARELQTRVLAQWSKNKYITQLRNDIAELLAEQGGLMTAMELAEAVLLRRGSVQPSPLRERWAQAVVRAAIETELMRQESRWILRRCGKRILVADNQQLRGEELADYAEALGRLADECARQQPLLAPVRALERVRAVPAPDSFAGLSNHRLLRLAVAASQDAALSSRAELYPRGLPAERSIELAQGALLGTQTLTVAEVQARIQGRYPEAEPLPGRPQLDELIQKLELGFTWDGDYRAPGVAAPGAYRLPQAGLTSYVSPTQASLHFTEHGSEAAEREVRQFEQTLHNALDSARFLALSVRPSQWQRAQQQLSQDLGLRILSFDALLLRHLHRLCDGMARPPNWEVVLKADAADPGSVDWTRLQGLVRRVLPAMADEVKGIEHHVLLTDAGLVGRYGLIDNWLGELREHLMNREGGRALVLLTASDVASTGAMIDNFSVPNGAGSREFARIPSAWIEGAHARSRSGEEHTSPGRV